MAKVFMVWSGEQERWVAEALQKHIKVTLQLTEVYCSSCDTPRGEAWRDTLFKNARQADFGVACITRQNMYNPWPLFESGLLCRNLSAAFFCPYLVDLSNKELPEPYNIFQAADASSEGTLRLLQSINNCRAEQRVDNEWLQLAHGMIWPKLEDAIRDYRKITSPGWNNHAEDMLTALWLRQPTINDLLEIAIQAQLPLQLIDLNAAPSYLLKSLLQLAIKQQALPAFRNAAISKYPQLSSWITQ